MSEDLRKRARDVWATEGAIRYREQALAPSTLSSGERAEHELQLAGYLKRLADLLQIPPTPEPTESGGAEPELQRRAIAQVERELESVREMGDKEAADDRFRGDEWSAIEEEWEYILAKVSAPPTQSQERDRDCEVCGRPDRASVHAPAPPMRESVGEALFNKWWNVGQAKDSPPPWEGCTEYIREWWMSVADVAIAEVRASEKRAGDE